jgi:peptidoglycan/xylan/chitin deacetylase (PgdA/CDA1 family)
VASRKNTIAKVFATLGLSQAGLAAQRALFSPFVRAINYHDVPPSMAEGFERQLDLYTQHFECIDPKKLLALQRGEWRSSRPGLILSFDDGLRSHADVVAPLLEARGWVGWFMVPFSFVEAAPSAQELYAEEHQIGHAGHDYGDPRIAISWDDVRRLSSHHVVGCHGLTHRRLGNTLAPGDFDAEIPQAKARLEAAAGREIDVFAWIGGEEASYSRGAADAIAQAGFRMSFMTNNAPIRAGCDLLQLQRTNIEAGDNEDLVRFQLSGIMDLFYRAKRDRVNRLTRIAPG